MVQVDDINDNVEGCEVVDVTSEEDNNEEEEKKTQVAASLSDSSHNDSNNDNNNNNNDDKDNNSSDSNDDNANNNNNAKGSEENNKGEEIKQKEISLKRGGRLEVFGTTYYNVVRAEEEKKMPALCSIRCNVEEEEVEKRGALVLVAVVDKSGSMGGMKMDSVKLTLEFIISKLTGKDKLGIVEYDTHTYTSLPLTHMDDIGKQRANNIVNEIRVGTSTNLSDGLCEGMRLLSSSIPSSSSSLPSTDNMRNNTISSVLLMTDGLPNQGITSSKGILQKMKMVGEEISTPFSVNTFGYGDAHDASLLKEISSSAEGTYYYINGRESIASSFADCLGGLVSVVAQSMEITITAALNHTIDHIHTPHPVREIIPFQSYRISLGNIQAGEERDLLFDLSLPSIPFHSLPSSNLANSAVYHLTLTYFDVQVEEMKEVKEEVMIMRCGEGEIITPNSPNSLVDRHRNRVLSADALEKAKKMAEERKFNEGKDLLLAIIHSIQSSPSSSHSLCQSLIKELETSLSLMQDESNYSLRGQYHLNRLSQSISTQRSSASPLFDTKAKSKMRFDSADFEMHKKLSQSSPSLPSPPPSLFSPSLHSTLNNNNNNNNGSISAINLEENNGKYPKRALKSLRRSYGANKRFDSCDFALQKEMTMKQVHFAITVDNNNNSTNEKENHQAILPEIKNNEQLVIVDSINTDNINSVNTDVDNNINDDHL